MCQPATRLPRFLSSLVMAGMLGFGAHSAFAEHVASACPGVSQGMFNASCSVGAAGNAYCDGECKRMYGTDSVGECFQEGCCLCTI